MYMHIVIMIYSRIAREGVIRKRMQGNVIVGYT